MAMSSVEAKYVAAARCYAQFLRIKNHSANYDVLYDKVPIFSDNTSVIAISNNLVLHSRTKHIDTKYHFIRDHILKGNIKLHVIPIDFQLADIFTKQLAEPGFTRLVAELGMLNINKVSLPPKKTVRAGLATLGLVDEKDPTLSSADFVNSSPLIKRYFSTIWRVIMLHIVKFLGGLNVDIGNILFSDLVAKLINDKKKREVNVCYTRYSSLIIEHLLGKDYKNDKLKTFKPYHISATSFKTPSANEVSQIPHMLKVSNISTMPKQNLILPSKVENVGNTINKSLSRTTMLPVDQPKASTDKRSKKNKNPSSSKPKTSKIFRES
ncbi:hypothetical protein Tco_0492623 [Tanacetum coccineum]